MVSLFAFISVFLYFFIQMPTVLLLFDKMCKEIRKTVVLNVLLSFV